jgi:hypothetical protein
MRAVQGNFWRAAKFFGWRAVFRRLIKGHWSVYTDLIGTSLSEATTETAMTGSPYSPLASGRLKKLILVASGSAASALWNGGYAVVESVSFGGVKAYVPFCGVGLKTAPAFGGQNIYSVDVDLAVRTGVVITAKLKHETADTPVTFEGQLYGVFEG